MMGVLGLLVQVCLLCTIVSVDSLLYVFPLGVQSIAVSSVPNWGILDPL